MLLRAEGAVVFGSHISRVDRSKASNEDIHFVSIFSLYSRALNFSQGSNQYISNVVFSGRPISQGTHVIAAGWSSHGKTRRFWRRDPGFL